jgi:hypothetical protein
MKAWNDHVVGAAALLRVRGLEQFQHRIGLNMFFELRSQIVYYSRRLSEICC